MFTHGPIWERMGYAKQLLQLIPYVQLKEPLSSVRESFTLITAEIRFLSSILWRQSSRMCDYSVPMFVDIQAMYTRSEACCGLDYGFLLYRIGCSLPRPFLISIPELIVSNKTGKQSLLVELNKINGEFLIDHQCEIQAYPIKVKSGF